MRKTKTKVILKGKYVEEKDDDYIIDVKSITTGDPAVMIQMMVSTLVDMLFDNDIKETGFNIGSLKRVITNEYKSQKKEKENENSL